MNLRRCVASLSVLALSLGLVGCGGPEKTQVKPPHECVKKITPAKAPAPDPKAVTPATTGPFPEVISGKEFGEKPEIKPGVGAPPKELQRKILIKGTGPEVTSRVDISADYLGQLWQGGVFDNSYDRKEPLTINLRRVVPGWTWGLNGTHVGDRVELVIPPDMGYGAEGQGDKIPANSTLVFIVDVIYAPPTLNAGELAGMTELLSKSTPTEAKLPAGLYILCDPGQEPQPVVVEGSEVPTEPTRVWTLKGKGEVIKADDMVGYVGVTGGWGNKPESTWTNGTSVHYALAKDIGAVGKTVGSRLVIVGPPNQDAPQAVVQVADIVSATPVGRK